MEMDYLYETDEKRKNDLFLWDGGILRNIWILENNQSFNTLFLLLYNSQNLMHNLNMGLIFGCKKKSKEYH